MLPDEADGKNQWKNSTSTTPVGWVGAWFIDCVPHNDHQGSPDQLPVQTLLPATFSRWQKLHCRNNTDNSCATSGGSIVAWRQSDWKGDCPKEFTELELDAVFRSVKDGSAAVYENILPEFLKHLGPKAKSWLVLFYAWVTREKKMPRARRQAKVIAILKPGKDPNLVASYRPISLLPVCFKGGGVSPQPPPVCSINLDDATAATGQRRQYAHHTPATGGEEREIEPIKWMGIIRRPCLARASGGNLARTPGLHPYSLREVPWDFFYDHRESGPQFNVSSEGRCFLIV